MASIFIYALLLLLFNFISVFTYSIFANSIALDDFNYLSNNINYNNRSNNNNN